MTAFIPYRSGGKTGWRKRQDDAAGRVEERASEAQDQELQRIRAERQSIREAGRLAVEAERAALAEHEMIDLPRELAGFIKSGRAARSFGPFLLDALAAYLAAHPQFRPRTLADAVPEPMSEEEAIARNAARHGLPTQTPAQQVLKVVEPERRGRGRPPKFLKQVDITEDGAILEN